MAKRRKFFTWCYAASTFVTLLILSTNESSAYVKKRFKVIPLTTASGRFFSGKPTSAGTGFRSRQSSNAARLKEYWIQNANFQLNSHEAVTVDEALLRAFRFSTGRPIVVLIECTGTLSTDCSTEDVRQVSTSTCQKYLISCSLDTLNRTGEFLWVAETRGSWHRRYFEIALQRLNDGKSIALKKLSLLVDETDNFVRSEWPTVAHGVPILSQGLSPEETLSIPIPDAHMVGGQLYDLDHQFRADLASKSLSNRYTGKPLKDWTQLENSLAFRGQEVPTFDPSPYKQGELLIYPRTEYCEALTHNSGSRPLAINFGFTSRNPVGRILRSTANCSSTPLTEAQMSEHRYLLSVDGYGPSYDGSFWKLASSSTVFMHIDSATQKHVNTQFYYPLLKSYEHYVPCTPHSLSSQLEYCMSNELICQDIALKSYRLMKEIIDENIPLQYTGLLLQHLSHLSS